jgi:hypothetical protein
MIQRIGEKIKGFAPTVVHKWLQIERRPRRREGQALSVTCS